MMNPHKQHTSNIESPTGVSRSTTTEESVLNVARELVKKHRAELVHYGRDLSLTSPLEPMKFLEISPTRGFTGGNGSDPYPAYDGDPGVRIPRQILSVLRLDCNDGNTLLFIKQQPIARDPKITEMLSEGERRYVSVVATKEPDFYAIIATSSRADSLVEGVCNEEAPCDFRSCVMLDSRDTKSKLEWAKLAAQLHKKHVAAPARALKKEAETILQALSSARESYPGGWLEEGSIISKPLPQKGTPNHKHHICVAKTLPEPLADLRLELTLSREWQTLDDIVVKESYSMGVALKATGERDVPDKVTRAFWQLFDSVPDNRSLAEALYKAALSKAEPAVQQRDSKGTKVRRGR